HKTGKTNIARISDLVNVLADLHNMGHEIILVSSGAIAIGTSRLGLKRKPDTIMGKQAAAAVGQGELMFLYDKFFGEYDVVVSQLLFTYDALENSDNKEHLTNTFNQLLEYGSIPVVNENDSVSIEELLNGDNDCLSATVAELIGADMLILLTDTDGLYDGNPSENPEARLIDIVEEITEEIEAFAGGAGKRGTGGFMTKVKAAKIATSAGIPVVVMNGADPKKIYDVLNGENVGTKFLS
ncbi:glutamate 5-kinase, partial [Eubacterium sp.]|uniref:glutamate 5-kinase n=1 Tax=Eubacterium sp. TaxID=142586 RepID=UPI0040283D07